MTFPLKLLKLDGQKKIWTVFFAALFVFLVIFSISFSSLSAAPVGPGGDCSAGSGNTCDSTSSCVGGTCKTGVSAPLSTSNSSIGIGGKVLNFITGFAADAVTTAVLGVAYIISILVGLLLALAGWFVDFSLSLNGEVMNLPVVQIGWKIVRDVANLGFVLGIIIIAFATILGNQTFGIKKSLYKLVIAAILINFSLSIGGVFLDASAVATNFFIQKATPAGASGLSTAITKAFAPQRLWDVQANVQQSASQGGQKILLAIASLFFIIIFSWMGVVSYLALGAMLMVRFVWIAFLLILAPIAWLGWVFPELAVGGQGNLASTWWNRFIKWTFFPPIVSFFLYLALFAVQYQAAIQSAATSDSGTALNSALLVGSGGAGITAIIGSMFVFCALLNGGLIAANKLGIEGAQAAETWANKAAGYLGGKAKSTAKGTGAWAHRRVVSQGAKTDDKGETTTRFQRGAASVANALNFIPLVGRLGRATAKGVTKYSQGTLEETKKIQKEKFDGMTRNEMRSVMENPGKMWSRLTMQERAAFALALAKDKMFGEYKDTPEKLAPYTEAAQRIGFEEELRKQVGQENPGLAVDLLGVAEAEGTKYSSPGDASKFSEDDIKRFAAILRPSFMADIANNGSDEKQKALVNAINGAMGIEAERLEKINKTLERMAEKAKEQDLKTPEGRVINSALTAKANELKEERQTMLRDNPVAGRYETILGTPTLARHAPRGTYVADADVDRIIAAARASVPPAPTPPTTPTPTPAPAPTPPTPPTPTGPPYPPGTILDPFGRPYPPTT